MVNAGKTKRLYESLAMNKSSKLLNIYTAFFLVFLFTPMILLMVASVNDHSPPSVTKWEGFTAKWYSFYWVNEDIIRSDDVLRSLDRDRFIRCFVNSLTVASIVVPLSLILGMAGAITLTRLNTKYNSLLWWLLLSPMLAPGIILGLSTLIFWRDFGVNAGLFTIIMAQTTFISSYPMLIIMARLQRQPRELEHAAFDLGAGPIRTFWRITLPFLFPALASSAVVAFLASVENYNTTMFAKGGSCTLATEIGSMVRNPNGHPPIINALGTFIIIFTLGFAIIYTFVYQKKDR